MKTKFNLTVMVAALVVFGPLSAEAAYTPDCGEAYRELRKETRKILIRDQVVSVKESDWKILKTVEQKALKAYKRAMYEKDWHESFHIQTEEYRALISNKKNGFKISISAGGDEDIVTYYYNQKDQLLYWYWYNQSPASKWVCEGYKKP